MTNPSPTTAHPTPVDTIPDRQMNFPLEIFLVLIPMLAHPELAQCRRVSRFFSSVATPHFYKKHRIDLSKPETFENPADDTGKRTRFSLTEHLTITSHSNNVCEDISPILLPNLITLRIVGQALEPHTCSSQEPIYGSRAICPFLAHLHPLRLIMSGNLNIYSGVNSPVLGFPPESVEELVVVLGPTDTRAVVSLKCGVRGSIKRLLLVMPPETAAKRSETAAERYENKVTYSSMSHLHAIRLRHAQAERIEEALAAACKGADIKITVIGMGVAGEDVTGAGSGHELENCKREVQRDLVKRGMDAKDAAVKVAGINFVQSKDYDGEVC